MSLSCDCVRSSSSSTSFAGLLLLLSLVLVLCPSLTSLSELCGDPPPGLRSLPNFFLSELRVSSSESELSDSKPDFLSFFLVVLFGLDNGLGVGDVSAGFSLGW